MSKICPLCGKSKSDELLFCNDCQRKVKSEYEVNIPDDKTPTKDEDLSNNLKQESTQVAQPDDIKNQIDTPQVTKKKPKHKKAKWLWIITLIVICIIGTFYFYMQAVKQSNRDLMQWDSAKKENTTVAYLSYIEAFPDGKYYKMAEKNLIKLKLSEKEKWQLLKSTDNTSEINSFIEQNPHSVYLPLAKKRLDSLTWVASMNDNTLESYSNYISLSSEHQFVGDYIAEAKKRQEMLTQSYPIVQADLDNIKTVVDEFFRALSNVDAENINKHLSPTVYSFFGTGGGKREKIVGDLIMSAAKENAAIINFVPNLSAIIYSRNKNNYFAINVPMQKKYLQKDGKVNTTLGYIVQLEMDDNFQIITVSEHK